MPELECEAAGVCVSCYCGPPFDRARCSCSVGMALRVHRAALRGDVAELDALLDAEPVLVNGRGERNTTPLMAAAAGGQVIASPLHPDDDEDGMRNT